MAVDNKTEDTAYLTKTVEMPDGSFRPTIIHMDHTVAPPGMTAAALTQHLSNADSRVAEAEVRARAAHGKEAGGTTSSGGSIKKGK